MVFNINILSSYLYFRLLTLLTLVIEDNCTHSFKGCLNSGHQNFYFGQQFDYLFWSANWAAIFVEMSGKYFLVK
jgi:hypothetical protein